MPNNYNFYGWANGNHHQNAHYNSSMSFPLPLSIAHNNNNYNHRQQQFLLVDPSEKRRPTETSYYNIMIADKNHAATVGVTVEDLLQIPECELLNPLIPGDWGYPIISSTTTKTVLLVDDQVSVIASDTRHLLDYSSPLPFSLTCSPYSIVSDQAEEELEQNCEIDQEQESVEENNSMLLERWLAHMCSTPPICSSAVVKSSLIGKSDDDDDDDYIMVISDHDDDRDDSVVEVTSSEEEEEEKQNGESITKHHNRQQIGDADNQEEVTGTRRNLLLERLRLQCHRRKHQSQWKREQQNKKNTLKMNGLRPPQMERGENEDVNFIETMTISSSTTAPSIRPMTKSKATAKSTLERLHDGIITRKVTAQLEQQQKCSPEIGWGLGDARAQEWATIQTLLHIDLQWTQYRQSSAIHPLKELIYEYSLSKFVEATAPVLFGRSTRFQHYASSVVNEQEYWVNLKNSTNIVHNDYKLLELFLALDLAQTLPTMALLSSEDKAKQLRSVALGVSYFGHAYKSVQRSSPVLQLADGHAPEIFWEKALEQIQQNASTLDEAEIRLLKKISRLKAEISGRGPLMQALAAAKLSHTEFVVLRTMLLLNFRTPSLSPEGQQVLEAESQRLSKLLASHLERELESADAAGRRFCELLRIQRLVAEADKAIRKAHCTIGRSPSVLAYVCRVSRHSSVFSIRRAEIYFECSLPIDQGVVVQKRKIENSTVVESHPSGNNNLNDVTNLLQLCQSHQKSK